MIFLKGKEFRGNTEKQYEKHGLQKQRTNFREKRNMIYGSNTNPLPCLRQFRNHACMQLCLRVYIFCII